LAALLPLRLLTGARLLGALAGGSLPLRLRPLTTLLLLLLSLRLLPFPRPLLLGALARGSLSLRLRSLTTLLLLLSLRLLSFSRPLLLGALP